jgi:beta-N-acetylhexosaminidase
MISPAPEHHHRALLTAIQWLTILGMFFAVIFPLNPAQAKIDNINQQNPSQIQQETATPEPINLAATKAQAILEGLTPEEKVGQLFLVTFTGNNPGRDSEIYDLINNYYVSGVMLLASNDNFKEQGQTAEGTIELVSLLQSYRQEASQQSRVNPVSGESFTPAYIPLFIAISQEGDGYPYDQILHDITTLPNQMAIGATWESELARQAGSVSGQELAALGVNMIFGPSLDVLEAPHTGVSSDLGSRTFGGDPYWVGKLGQAYIEGLHTGSKGLVTVIAKHFPGYGGSDRLPEDEVATVRKSLDQLLGFELTPFINVTGQAPTPDTTADGLLTAHIRYQGFQGNIRATTRPVSFDPQALRLLLGLPEIEKWRSNGGVMVSDNLGSQAVRGFYDLTSQPFDMPRRVALNAFLAGNDLLYASDFSSGEFDSVTSIKRTLEFFAQKYREDSAFAQRVDESVLRILTLKNRVYEDLSLEQVLAPLQADTPIGQSQQVVFDIARRGSTLISPTQAELDETIPDAPNQNDRIVFVTDTRVAKQCSQCKETPLISNRALEQSILRLYGPQAGGQVTPANMISYSLEELQEMLDKPNGSTQIERSLNRANWIVFSMLDSSLRYPSYQTLSRFLTERPDLFQKKRVIVFAFNAPYFLDATNISKLTAYYGLYSKAPQFIDMAAYLLFQELRAEGASPVSIPGISYDLSVALVPDPNQIIPLMLDLPKVEPKETGSTPEPTPEPVYHVGDMVPIRTGIIIDHNGHAVPDGTPVEFTFYPVGQGNPERQIRITSDGIARTSFTVNTSGQLEIKATSELAESEVLTLDIPAPSGEELATPSETPTATPEPTPTSTTKPVAEQTTPPPTNPKPGVVDWLMALVVSSGIAWLGYKFVSNTRSMHWGMRSGLLALVGGLVAYSYLALQLPGSEIFFEQPLPRGVLITTISGTLLGFLAAWIWYHAQPPSVERK